MASASSSRRGARTAARGRAENPSSNISTAQWRPARGRGPQPGGPLEGRGDLYSSPATLLEIQLLLETGRLRLRAGARVRQIAADARWMMDDPSSLDWFDRALETGWPPDPFDRLLVAHAQLRGWRIATGDGELLERLGLAASLEL